MSALNNITPNQRRHLILNTVAMQMTTMVTFSVIWNLTQNRQWDTVGTWHILCCTVGCGTLMTKALAAFNEYNIYTLGTNRIQRGKSHALTMTISFILIGIGIALKIYDKSRRDDPKHFSTPHGILGLTSLILSFLALISGAVVNNSKNLGFIRPVILKFNHNILGQCAYLVGIIALGFGIKNYLQFNSATSISMIVIMALYATYALLPSSLSLFNQAKDIAL